MDDKHLVVHGFEGPFVKVPVDLDVDHVTIIKEVGGVVIPTGTLIRTFVIIVAVIVRTMFTFLTIATALLISRGRCTERMLLMKVSRDFIPLLNQSTPHYNVALVEFCVLLCCDECLWLHASRPNFHQNVWHHQKLCFSFVVNSMKSSEDVLHLGCPTEITFQNRRRGFSDPSMFFMKMRDGDGISAKHESKPHLTN